MFDPGFSDTIVRLAMRGVEVVSTIPGIPWQVPAVLGIALVLFVGVRALKGRGEPAPEPLSDGETVEDRAVRAENLRITQPIRMPPPTREDGNSGGNG